MSIRKQTYTYKVCQDLELEADVYTSHDGLVHPVILWLHGGALIMGHREKDIRRDQLEAYVQAGYTFVSIDYRLAPETKLAGIITDLQDASRWIRDRGSSSFQIDPERIAIVGHSAGGYLALMAGFCLDTQPKAIVSFYGYGDIAGSWYSDPSPFYCRQPAVSKEEAFSTVGTLIFAGTHGEHNRHRFYLYCRQQGLWPKQVTGHDPHNEPGAFYPYCPIRNVTPRYPPTLLLHGEEDNDVPWEQSYLMGQELERARVEHELITIKGGGHSFDKANGGLRDTVNSRTFGRVLAFLDEHLG